jgi:zinc transport system substrate-binding protein
VLVASAVAALLASSACGSDEGAGDGRVTVAASFAPLAHAAEQVGGGNVRVTDLTPSGTEPHDLELTTDQVDAIEDADVVLVVGRDFQPAVETVAGRRGSATVSVLDTIALPDVSGELRDDPHVWLDPQLMAEIADLAHAALRDADPAHTDAYDRNEREFRSQLEALDGEFRRGLSGCARRTIVTSHAAFGWLARRYGLEQRSASGIDPEAEPSADAIADLADVARDEGVTTVFTEPLVSDRIAETIAREAGGLVVDTLDPLESLSDNEDAYLAAQRANLAALRRALDC